jgi:2,3-bisphosphoglycerate-dependent phosphoglycerate mutase
MSDERHPMHDAAYKLLPPSALPCSESLATTLDRVMPFWNDTICPQVMDGKNAVVVAHGNSIRAIVKELTGMDNQEILGYNVPTAVPLIFEFDSEMKAINNYYLMDA